MSEAHIEAPIRKWPSRMRRRMASQYLQEVHCVKLSPSTLAKLAVIGGGPRFRKDGIFPIYESDHLDEFAISRLGSLRSSTGVISGVKPNAISTCLCQRIARHAHPGGDQ